LPKIFLSSPSFQKPSSLSFPYFELEEKLLIRNERTC
jgi:hypothetical protein